MATSVRAEITQRPGMDGVEITFVAEAIVDDVADAHAQGIEVYQLVEAFETGMKEAAGE